MTDPQDQSELPTERESRWIYWPFAVIAMAHVAVAAGIAFAPTHPGDSLVWVGIIFGSTFGQIAWLAIWTAFGPLPAMLRGPAAIGGASLASVALISFFSRGGSPDSLEVVLVIGAAGTLLYLAVQAPLWWLRLRSEMHWRNRRLASAPAGMGETQFSLRHLMIATTVIAFTLGIARLVMASFFSFEDEEVTSEPFILFAVLMSFSALLSWIILAAASAPERWWISIALVLLLQVPFSWTEASMFSLVERHSSNNYFVIGCMNLTISGWLWCCARLLMAAGFYLK